MGSFNIKIEKCNFPFRGFKERNGSCSGFSKHYSVAFVNEVDDVFSFEGELAQNFLDFYKKDIKKLCLEKIQPPLSKGSCVFIEDYPNIIHVVTNQQGGETDFKTLCYVVKNSLLLAESNYINIVYMPLIGSFNGKMSKDDCAFTILEQLQDIFFNANFKQLCQVILVARNDKEYEVIEKYYTQLFGGNKNAKNDP